MLRRLVGLALLLGALLMQGASLAHAGGSQTLGAPICDVAHVDPLQDGKANETQRPGHAGHACDSCILCDAALTYVDPAVSDAIVAIRLHEHVRGIVVDQRAAFDCGRIRPPPRAPPIEV